MRLFVFGFACVFIMGACGSEDQSRNGQVGETAGDTTVPEWCDALPRAGYAGLEPIEVDSDWFEVWDVGDGVVKDSFASPFCEPSHSPASWDRIVVALRPGGRFTGGVRAGVSVNVSGLPVDGR